MHGTQGYYTLIQYSPDPSRQEALNLGVALIRPSARMVVSKLAKTTERLRTLFGAIDGELFAAERESLVERLSMLAAEAATVEDFSDFIARRTGKLRLTALRSVRIDDADVTIAELFKKLVQTRTADHKFERARTLFEKELAKAGVAEVVQHPVEVTIKSLARPIHVPFAYKNGRWNLIDPVNFTVSSAWDGACRRAVEGKKLFDHGDDPRGRMKLVVVGQFSEQTRDLQKPIHDMMREHEVGFYPLDKVGPLIADIRAHASA